MPRVPLWLKPWLVPVWNGLHHGAWWASEHLDALRHRRYERCVVCGRTGPMLYRPRVVPPRLAELWGLSPRLTATLARRESCQCAWCGAQLRARRLTQVLLETYAVPGVRSAADWVRQGSVRALKIAEVNRIEGLHHWLLELPGLAYSEYNADAEPGSVAEGVRCEDLCRLTYADESFDLVLTSETLEHVPDLERALAEIHRVLVPGGRHVFTVPVLPGVPATFARARLDPEGFIVAQGPLICHPGGDAGYPVFTEFGADFPEYLRRAGFEVSVHFGPPSEDDLAQVYGSRKLPAANSARPSSRDANTTPQAP